MGRELRQLSVGITRTWGREWRHSLSSSSWVDIAIKQLQSRVGEKLSAREPAKAFVERSATVHFAAVRSWIHSGHHAAVGRAQ